MKFLLEKLGQVWGKLADLVGKLPAKRVDMGIALLVTVAATGVYVLETITVSRNVTTTRSRGIVAPIAFLDNIEVRSLDARFNTRGTRAVDDRIVIVGLDEKTLQKTGSFPIPRNYYAKVSAASEGMVIEVAQPHATAAARPAGSSGQ